MTKPLNMLVSWDRNIDPDKKVCSCAATYSRVGAPASFHARLFFHTREAAEVWARQVPKWVGLRIKEIMVNVDGVRRYVWRVMLDINMTGRGKPVSDNGESRYKRFITTVNLSSYSIDWQSPSYVRRAYGDRLAFEQA